MNRMFCIICGKNIKSAIPCVAAVDIQGYTFDLYSKTKFREEFSYLDYSFIKGNPREVVVDGKIIDKQQKESKSSNQA